MAVAGVPRASAARSWSHWEAEGLNTSFTPRAEPSMVSRPESPFQESMLAEREGLMVSLLLPPFAVITPAPGAV